MEAVEEAYSNIQGRLLADLEPVWEMINLESIRENSALVSLFSVYIDSI